MHRRTVLGLGLLGALPPALAIGPKPPHLSVDAALDAELAAIADDPACPLASVSVLAIRDGVIYYEKQLGYRVVSDGVMNGKPANRDTLYRIASVSKLVTTLGLMRLIEEGRATLDADVSNYLGFPLRNPAFAGQAITLRMLLTHTSSLRDDAGYSWPLAVALKDAISAAPAGVWSARAPGDYFTYCNLGWGIIGTVMERIGSERFDKLMQRLLLAPLGLRGGYNVAELPAADLADLATLYRKRTVDTEVWNLDGPWIAQADDFHAGPPAPPSGLAGYTVGSNATPFSPTGGLRISAHGLGIVMLMLMNGGMHDGKRILRGSTLTEMFTRAWTYDGKGGNGDSMGGHFNAWGLGNQQFPDQAGMRLVETGGLSAAGHLGDAYGLRAVFAADLQRRNGVVVLIGGSGADPATQRGRYSALARFEERIVTSLYRRAIAGDKA